MLLITLGSDKVEVEAPDRMPTGTDFLLRKGDVKGSGIATRVSLPCTEHLATRMLDRLMPTEDEQVDVPAEPRDELLTLGYITLLLGNLEWLTRSRIACVLSHGSRARVTDPEQWPLAAASKTQRIEQQPRTLAQDGLWDMSRDSSLEECDRVICMMGSPAGGSPEARDWEEEDELPNGSPQPHGYGTIDSITETHKVVPQARSCLSLPDPQACLALPGERYTH